MTRVYKRVCKNGTAESFMLRKVYTGGFFFYQEPVIIYIQVLSKFDSGIFLSEIYYQSLLVWPTF